MTTGMFLFMLFQAWLMIAVAHPVRNKSNAAFYHTFIWFIAWLSYTFAWGKG